jgi:hypothetical protein
MIWGNWDCAGRTWCQQLVQYRNSIVFSEGTLWTTERTKTLQYGAIRVGFHETCEPLGAGISSLPNVCAFPESSCRGARCAAFGCMDAPPVPAFKSDRARKFHLGERKKEMNYASEKTFDFRPHCIRHETCKPPRAGDGLSQRVQVAGRPRDAAA